MIKLKNEGTSDYAILKQKYEELKADIPMEFIIKKMERLKNVDLKLIEAEKTLKIVLDLINSNEDLVHFYTAKKEIRKPIEEYFKKVK